jgi:hypothetical protein
MENIPSMKIKKIATLFTPRRSFNMEIWPTIHESAQCVRQKYLACICCDKFPLHFNLLQILYLSQVITCNSIGFIDENLKGAMHEGF